MDGYEVKFYYSSDDQCYVAQIVEFIGCATEGETPEEALNNLCALKEIWIQAVPSKGYPIPPRYTAHMTAPSPPELIAF